MKGGQVLRNIFGGGNLGSVGKGNYAGGTDDFYPDGYGETLSSEQLWSSSYDPEEEISETNKPDNAWYFMNSGKTNVNVKAGTVGFMLTNSTAVIPSGGAATTFGAYGDKAKLIKVVTKDDLPTGNIFGGCRGQAAAEVMSKADMTFEKSPYFFLGYVNETAVTIGDGSGGPRIYGSIYGGGQDGHVRRGTNVTVNKGEIGIPYNNAYRTLLGTNGMTLEEELNNLNWLHRGNVYGAGSGIGKYEDSSGEHPSSSAGSITHTTNVTINSGINGVSSVYSAEEAAAYNTAHGLESGDEGYVSEGDVKTPAVAGNVIYRNVYGGGSLSSVSPPIVDEDHFPNADDTEGRGKMCCNTVNVSGTVGVVKGYNDKYGGEVYGASRGELSLEPQWYGVSVWTKVFINHGATIMGNVFGGGDAGMVKKDAKVVVGKTE